MGEFDCPFSAVCSIDDLTWLQNTHCAYIYLAL